MRHPIRTKLYVMADLALAFATLEAVRLPEHPPGDAPRRAEVDRCTPPASCRTARDRRRNRGPSRDRRADVGADHVAAAAGAAHHAP
jgi:hypothetical protein